MLLYKKLKVPVIPSTHFIKTTCFYQMKNIVDGLTDKSEDRIERDHQDGKRSEIKYCGVTNFRQSQISQLK